LRGSSPRVGDVSPSGYRLWSFVRELWPYVRSYRTVAEALPWMTALRFRHLPVIDEGNRVIGVLTPLSALKVVDRHKIESAKALFRIRAHEVMQGVPTLDAHEDVLIGSVHVLLHPSLYGAVNDQSGRPLFFLTYRELLQVLMQIRWVRRVLEEEPAWRAARDLPTVPIDVTVGGAVELVTVYGPIALQRTELVITPSSLLDSILLPGRLGEFVNETGRVLEELVSIRGCGFIKPESVWGDSSLAEVVRPMMDGAEVVRVRGQGVVDARSLARTIIDVLVDEAAGEKLTRPTSAK